MNWPEWQTVAALISDFVLATTLLVFVAQARAMRQQVHHLARQTQHLVGEEDRSASATRAGVYQGIAQLMIDLDRIFIDRPELRPYFYAGKVPPTDPIECARVAALAEAYVDLMDTFVTQAPHLTDHLSGPWRAYFWDLAKGSPAIQAYWLERRTWYDESMHALLDPVIGPHGSSECQPTIPDASEAMKPNGGAATSRIWPIE